MSHVPGVVSAVRGGGGDAAPLSSSSLTSLTLTDRHRRQRRKERLRRRKEKTDEILRCLAGEVVEDSGSGGGGGGGRGRSKSRPSAEGDRHPDDQHHNDDEDWHEDGGGGGCGPISSSILPSSVGGAPSASGSSSATPDARRPAEKAVNLWHLRSLALSRGGLLTPALRRRAWPKLVGVDEHILSTSTLAVPRLLVSASGNLVERSSAVSVSAPPSAASASAAPVDPLVSASANINAAASTATATTAASSTMSVGSSGGEDANSAASSRNQQQNQSQSHATTAAARGAASASASDDASNMSGTAGSSSAGGAGRGGGAAGADKVVELSEYDADIIRRDVGRTVWHVEREIQRLRREFEAERVGVSSAAPGMVGARGRARPGRDSVGLAGGTLGMGTAMRSPGGRKGRGRSPGESGGGGGGGGGGTGGRRRSRARSPTGGGGVGDEAEEVPTSVRAGGGGGGGTNPVSSLSRVRKSEERELLMTVIASVLQTPPPPDAIHEDGQSHGLGDPDDDASVGEGEGHLADDGRLHYYQGFHDIVALFLINLESPSLTSLVLSKLAHTHLRDAMRTDFRYLRSALRLTFLPLLEGLDREVHDHIVMSEMDGSCVFALSWILSWFGHDILDVEVASRLVDFFLASHALMPIYLSVCVLSHPMNREKILTADCDFGSLHMVLAKLPQDMMRLKRGGGMGSSFDDLFQLGDSDFLPSPDDDFEAQEQGTAELMELFEELIEMATNLMIEVPPSRLLRISSMYRSRLLAPHLSAAPSISLLRTSPPPWAVAFRAPTDWSLLRKAKTLRDMSPRSRRNSRREMVRRATREGAKLTATRVVGRSATDPNLRKYRIAVDASGVGSAYEWKMRRKRRRKMMTAAGAALAVLLAILVLVRMCRWGGVGAGGMDGLASAMGGEAEVTMKKRGVAYISRDLGGIMDAQHDEESDESLSSGQQKKTTDFTVGDADPGVYKDDIKGWRKKFAKAARGDKNEEDKRDQDVGQDDPTVANAERETVILAKDTVRSRPSTRKKDQTLSYIEVEVNADQIPLKGNTKIYSAEVGKDAADNMGWSEERNDTLADDNKPSGEKETIVVVEATRVLKTNDRGKHRSGRNTDGDATGRFSKDDRAGAERPETKPKGAPSDWKANSEWRTVSEWDDDDGDSTPGRPRKSTPGLDAARQDRLRDAATRIRHGPSEDSGSGYGNARTSPPSKERKSAFEARAEARVREEEDGEEEEKLRRQKVKTSKSIVARNQFDSYRSFGRFMREMLDNDGEIIFQ